MTNHTNLGFLALKALSPMGYVSGQCRSHSTESQFFFFLERVMGLMPSPRLPPAHIICTVVSKDLTCTEYHRLWHASISEIIPRVTIQARTIPAASLFSM